MTDVIAARALHVLAVGVWLLFSLFGAVAKARLVDFLMGGRATGAAAEASR